MKTISFRTDILPMKNSLYRLALRITQNATVAEDVVQDTMIKVWDKRDQWDEIENINAFTMTICRNLSLDQLKRRDNQNTSLDNLTLEHHDGKADPLEQTSLQNRMEMVRKLIDSLPEKQKSCMQLRDFEEKPYKEIAEILDITEEQVKINIFRARKTVKEAMLKIDNYGL